MEPLTSNGPPAKDAKLYVYFRPCAGLNDILNEFSLVISYCQKYRRILLVYRAISYGVDLLSFFSIKDTGVEIMNNIDSIQKIVGSKVMNRPVRYCLSRRHRVFTDTNKASHFELNREYPNDRVLCYIRCGGGNRSHAFFRNHVRLLVHVHQEFTKKRFNIKSREWYSIQVRNTDRKCNYKGIKTACIPKGASVYVATDDPQVIAYFQKKLTNNTIYNFTTFGERRINLHYNSSVSGKTRIMDTLHDLMFLAKSKRILSVSKGGFIGLARSLHKHGFPG